MHTRSKTYKNRRLFFRVRRNSADKGSNPFTVFSVSCSFSSLCLNSQQTKSEVKVKEIDWRGLGANFLHVASVAQKLAKRERERTCCMVSTKIKARRVMVRQEHIRIQEWREELASLYISSSMTMTICSLMWHNSPRLFRIESSSFRRGHVPSCLHHFKTLFVFSLSLSSPLIRVPTTLSLCISSFSLL